VECDIYQYASHVLIKIMEFFYCKELYHLSLVDSFYGTQFVLCTVLYTS
jgi:hypothetical protein